MADGKKLVVTTAGPRQVKTLQDASRKLTSLSRTYKTRSGFKGEPETQKVSDYAMYSPCSPAMWDKPQEAVEAIGDKFGWTITRENAAAMTQAFLDAARDLYPHIPIKDELRDRAAEDAQKAKWDAQKKAADEAEAIRRAAAQAQDGAVFMSVAEILARKPAWATAAIVAEEDFDKSDPMSDYHGHTTGRHVLIGWRSGKREDFSQLRRAAATFLRTKHMGPGCETVTVLLYREPDKGENTFRGVFNWTDERGRTRVFTTEAQATAAIEAAFTEARKMDHKDVPQDLAWDHGYKVHVETVEHRENYSMGAGNYLKAGFRDSTGWGVKSRSIPSGEGRMEVHLPTGDSPADPDDGERSAAVAGGTAADGATVSHNTEQDGIEIRFPAKPAADVLASLKSHGWRWSRFSGCWYKRNAPGVRTWAESLLGIRSTETAAFAAERAQGRTDAQAAVEGTADRMLEAVAAA